MNDVCFFLGGFAAGPCGGLPTPKKQAKTTTTQKRLLSFFCLVTIGLGLSRREVCKRVRAVREVKVLDDGYVVALMPAI